MKARILSILNKEKLKAFCEGPIYPIVIGSIIAVGALTGFEVALNLIFATLTCISLALCNTIRPFVVSLCTFILQLSAKNSPFYPNYSDHYTSSWRFPALIISAVAVGAFLIYFIIKNKLYRGLSLKKTPLLLKRLFTKRKKYVILY